MLRQKQGSVDNVGATVWLRRKNTEEAHNVHFVKTALGRSRRASTLRRECEQPVSSWLGSPSLVAYIYPTERAHVTDCLAQRQTEPLHAQRAERADLGEAFLDKMAGTKPSDRPRFFKIQVSQLWRPHSG